MNCKIATNRKNTYYVSIFFTLTLFIIDSRIRILLTLCIIILSSNPNPIPTNAGRFRGGFFPLIDKVNTVIIYYNFYWKNNNYYYWNNNMNTFRWTWCATSPHPLIRRFAPCFILKGGKQDVEDETPLVWRDRVGISMHACKCL